MTVKNASTFAGLSFYYGLHRGLIAKHGLTVKEELMKEFNTRIKEFYEPTRVEWSQEEIQEYKVWLTKLPVTKEMVNGVLATDEKRLAMLHLSVWATGKESTLAFTSKLYDLMMNADLENLTKLGSVFPDEYECFLEWKASPIQRFLFAAYNISIND